MNEARLHILLKQIARMMARDWDPDASISEEESVKFGTGRYKIDLIARGKLGSMAFECNNTQVSKLLDIDMLFNRVVHLRPEDAIEYLMSELEDATRPIIVDSSKLVKCELLRSPKGFSVILKMQDGKILDLMMPR